MKNRDDRQRKQTAQAPPPVPSIDTRDPVDASSYDSFPASDPPARSLAQARPVPGDAAKPRQPAAPERRRHPS